MPLLVQVVAGVWQPELESLKGKEGEALRPLDSEGKSEAKGFRVVRSRTAWTLWRALHSCWGGLCMLLATAQVSLGLALSHAAPWIWAVWGSWLALLLVATILLLLDSLPLHSSNKGGSQGFVRWGKERAQNAHSEERALNNPYHRQASRMESAQTQRGRTVRYSTSAEVEWCSGQIPK